MTERQAGGRPKVVRMYVPSRDLTPDDIELIDFARQIVDANTDGVDGVYTMGAAVRGVDGNMYGGINLYHFTGGPCAELVALGHARASGARELSTIVAVGNCGRGPVGPCGRDRQVLFDYHPDIRVILPTAEGIKSVRIKDLMPLAAVWTVESGTQQFDPAIFENPPDS
jgi:cytidine deaminase